MYAFLILFILPVIHADLCKKCICNVTLYLNRPMFVTNCTFAGFNLNDLDLLQYLPEETEVLIFKGNDVQTLPANLFGTDKNLTKLKIIDMSDNKIQKIKGKTFHHVPMVERLILDHNSIALNGNSHPRMFSNLENLLELHLTDAFLDYNDTDLAKELHTIFIDSNLTKLMKLHLEQNDITNFGDAKVFCNLTNLMDLHLGDNNLKKLDFDLKCLPHLRYLDLERNKLESLSPEELTQFDAIAENHDFILNIDNNPFQCECNANNVNNWFHVTKVNVRNNETIQCRYSDENKTFYVKDFQPFACLLEVTGREEMHPFVHYFNYIVFSVVFALAIYLIFLSIRYTSEYCRNPIGQTGKVQYVVIRNPDDNKEVHMPRNKIYFNV